MEGNKTKRDLEDEIRGLKDQIKELENKDAYLRSARETRNLYTSYIESGFSEEQAFELIKAILPRAIK